VTFQVPCPVFTLPIRLIDRLAIDAGTRRPSVLVVRIDVIDEDDQAGIRHIYGERRIEMMLDGVAMQPDGFISGTDLTMNRLTLGGSMHASRNEPKYTNQELVCGCDVLIDEDRDDSLKGWHELLRLTATAMCFGRGAS
jgi:hypothetical protein